MKKIKANSSLKSTPQQILSYPTSAPPWIVHEFILQMNFMHTGRARQGKVGVLPEQVPEFIKRLPDIIGR